MHGAFSRPWVRSDITCCSGIRIGEPAKYDYLNGQANIRDQLKQLGLQCIRANNGTPPTLFVVVLPENGNDIYTAVKQ